MSGQRSSLGAGCPVTSAAPSTRSRALWLFTAAGSSGLWGASSGRWLLPLPSELGPQGSAGPASGLARPPPTLLGPWWRRKWVGPSWPLARLRAQDSFQRHSGFLRGWTLDCRAAGDVKRLGPRHLDSLFLSRFIYSLEINGLWSSGHSHCLGAWGQGEL